MILEMKNNFLYVMLLQKGIYVTRTGISALVVRGLGCIKLMHCMLTTAAWSQSKRQQQFMVGIGTKSSCFVQSRIVHALSILAGKKSCYE